MSERRKLQDLTIKDNFMFGAVMVDEELCREFLELALGFKIEKVTVSKEKSIPQPDRYGTFADRNGVRESPGCLRDFCM